MDPTAPPAAEARRTLRHSLILALFVALAAAGPVRPRASRWTEGEGREGSPASSAGNGTVMLPGNIPALAQPQNDFGFADPDLPMDHMIFTLKMGSSRKAALDGLLKDQQNPALPTYHRWLTPTEFGMRFGRSPQELAAIQEWLQSQGFRIDSVAKGGLWIDFSGTVSQVEQAFQTQIHNYLVDGKMYQANATNPSIPGRLADMVAGVVSLDNFPRKAYHTRPVPVSRAEYTSGTTHYVSPGDFATIYDLNPLYSASIDGTGVTIAIVGRTNPSGLLSAVSTFQGDMGLPSKPPNVIVNTNPGDLGGGEDDEAELDVEWSGAVAKGATIDFVVSASTGSTDGVDLSAQYIVDNDLAPIMSTSFGSCEQSMGTAENNFYESLWSQAAAEGITAFVSAGDSGASGCDGGNSTSGSGLAVNGLASTPYDVCAGGTEFNEGSGTYWSATNGTGYTSALSYIPEEAWNESGASTYCPSGDTCQNLWATGGGVSSVYVKPSWQEAPGVPADGMRDVPDVSLAAAGGHDGALVYLEDKTSSNGLYVIGGTSWSSPSWAGLMALIVQEQGGQAQGNANSRFYQLANMQYTNGAPVVFHDITTGNNTVPGVTGYSCTTAYDQATGLGTPDAYALVGGWNPCTPPGMPTGLTATAPANNQIALSWLAGGPAGSSYDVYRAVGACGSSGSFSLIASGIAVTSYTDATVSGGTTYAYEVSAVDSTGSCQSALSSCASAAATGACALPPLFAGLASVTNPQSATCTLALSWTAATPQCNPGDAVYYNIYRSTVSPFTPSASSRIATGFVGTSFSDDYGLASGTAYYYVVHAVDAANGAEDANTVTMGAKVTGPGSTLTTLYSDNFDGTGHSGLDGWETGTFVSGGSTADWRGVQACSPTESGSNIFRYGGTSCTSTYAQGRWTLAAPGGAAGIVVPADATSVRLSFYHRWNFYSSGGKTDGGTLMISTDNSTFTFVPASAIISGKSYTGTTSLSYSCASRSAGGSGRAAWTGTQSSMVQTVVDLDAAANAISGNTGGAAGKTLWIAFSPIIGCSGSNYGWFLDDVAITATVPASCTTGAALGSVKPVPDGQWVPGTPMQASKVAADGSTINLTWDTTTCTDANYNLYWGDGSDLPTYALQGSVCGLGNTGSASGLALPAVPAGQSFIWWVIAGTDGSQMESSWGKDSAGNERHPAASGQCGFTAKSTAATCP